MIERQEVNGRSALIAYLNNEMQPATKADHTAVKIVFDNGDILFGRRQITTDAAALPDRELALLQLHMVDRTAMTGGIDVLTAGDDDVCQICEDISDDGPYGLDEAESLLPAHPNCRCAFVPVDDERFASVHEDAADAGPEDEPRDDQGRWTSGGGGGSDNSRVGVQEINGLRADMVKSVQREYDEWSQDDEGIDCEVGAGGICDRVASAIGDVLAGHGVSTQSAGMEGDDHAWTLANLKEGVHEIDIPPSVYETGGGYSWTKKEGVTFTPDHIVVNKIDHPMSDEDFDRKYGS